MTTSATPILITWSAQLSVGIPSIDAQHQKLIGYINELHTAMNSGQGSKTVGDILDALVAYTVSHFSFEERLLRNSKYPGIDAHLSEHAKLVDSVKALQQEHRAGRLAVSVRVMSFLKSWLTDHILGVDKRYTAHLQAAGVK